MGDEQAFTRERDGFLVSTDRSTLDLDGMHAFLAESYWAKGIPRALLEKSVAHSLPFGLYHQGRQVGFARVVTDRATFAYLADVYVLPEHRGHGVGIFLMETVMAHPDLQGLRRWSLATRDAHTLYQRFGFKTPEDPSRLMEIVVKDAYLGPSARLL